MSSWINDKINRIEKKTRKQMLNGYSPAGILAMPFYH
jgi:hypothetical protein